MSVLCDMGLYFQVKSFQSFETSLLQELEYEKWLSIFSDDLRYRAPLVSVTDHRAGSLSSSTDLMLYDDSYDTLKLRVARAKSKRAWTETPPSRLRYFIDPIEIKEDDDALVVVSNMIIYQTRLQREENLFIGQRIDRIRRAGDKWIIFDRFAIVDRAVLPSKNLTVFF